MIYLVYIRRWTPLAFPQGRYGRGLCRGLRSWTSQRGIGKMIEKKANSFMCITGLFSGTLVSTGKRVTSIGTVPAPIDFAFIHVNFK